MTVEGRSMRRGGKGFLLIMDDDWEYDDDEHNRILIVCLSLSNDDGEHKCKHQSLRSNLLMSR